MKTIVLVIAALAVTSLVGSHSASAQPEPAATSIAAATFIMVCNVNGQMYNIDQNYGIYAPSGLYMGQLVTAATPSGWIAVRSDGVQFPVYGCQ
jgi:hypothetical protein